MERRHRKECHSAASVFVLSRQWRVGALLLLLRLLLEFKRE